MDSSSAKIVVIIGGSIVGIIVFISAMVGTSLKKLNTEEVGVAYNIHQKKLSPEVKREGLHPGPPGYRFIIFPSVFESIEYDDIECLNKDGVEIELIVQLQYRAQAKHLRQIILQFKNKDNYLKILRSVGDAAIHDACSAFNTTQFQSQRASFQDLVRKTLGRRFGTLWADVEDLQVAQAKDVATLDQEECANFLSDCGLAVVLTVQNIQRPESYEKVVRNKEAAKENIKIAENERPRLLVEAKTEKEEALTQAQITEQQAESEARVLLTKARAEAGSIRAAYDAEAAAFLKLKNETLSDSVAGLLSYLGVRVIAENNHTVNVAIDAPAKTKYTY